MRKLREPVGPLLDAFDGIHIHFLPPQEICELAALLEYLGCPGLTHAFSGWALAVGPGRLGRSPLALPSTLHTTSAIEEYNGSQFLVR